MGKAGSEWKCRWHLCVAPSFICSSLLRHEAVYQQGDTETQFSLTNGVAGTVLGVTQESKEGKALPLPGAILQGDKQDGNFSVM